MSNINEIDRMLALQVALKDSADKQKNDQRALAQRVADTALLDQQTKAFTEKVRHVSRAIHNYSEELSPERVTAELINQPDKNVTLRRENKKYDVRVLIKHDRSPILSNLLRGFFNTDFRHPVLPDLTQDDIQTNPAFVERVQKVFADSAVRVAVTEARPSRRDFTHDDVTRELTYCNAYKELTDSCPRVSPYLSFAGENRGEALDYLKAANRLASFTLSFSFKKGATIPTIKQLDDPVLNAAFGLPVQPLKLAEPQRT